MSPEGVEVLLENCPKTCGCPCEDDAAFVDEWAWGYTAWVMNYMGAEAAWGYSAQGKADLIANCPRACGLCSCWQGCFDTPDFRDESGFSCGAWAGYDCATSATEYMSPEGVEVLLENCPKTCGCPCEDDAAFVDEWAWGYTAWVMNYMGAEAAWGYSAQGKADLIANCPRACGLCSCWQGCFHLNATAEIDQFVEETEHLRLRNAAEESILNINPAPYFSATLFSTIVQLIVDEVLGY